MTNRYYELWDADSGNLVGAFAALAEAVEFLSHAVGEYGPDVLAGYILIGDADDAEPIADDALLRLVSRAPVATPTGA